MTDLELDNLKAYVKWLEHDQARLEAALKRSQETAAGYFHIARNPLRSLRGWFIYQFWKVRVLVPIRFGWV